MENERVNQFKKKRFNHGTSPHLGDALKTYDRENNSMLILNSLKYLTNRLESNKFFHIICERGHKIEV